MSQPFTAQLADLVVGLDAGSVPRAGIDLVELAFVDALGCVLAGSTSDEAAIAGRWAATMRGAPDCTVLGTGERFPAALAALVNATAGHALDLDDVSPAMTHPSTCLVPPLLA
jgi:2-methylcitrate dehydratase PrpD